MTRYSSCEASFQGRETAKIDDKNPIARVQHNNILRGSS